MTPAGVRSIVACASAAFASFGCGPAVDPARLAAVQVVGLDSALRGCRKLGRLEGKDSDRWVPGGPRYETAMLDLRKKAVLGGGNALVTDSIEPPSGSDYAPEFVVRARLFACSAQGSGSPVASSPVVPDTTSPSAATGSPAAPRLAAPAACEPDCSPSYVCLRGTCVSACNPLCGAGERCGTDRGCHPVSSLPLPAPVPP